jgi:hypothetical protein
VYRNINLHFMTCNFTQNTLTEKQKAIGSSLFRLLNRWLLLVRSSARVVRMVNSSWGSLNHRSSPVAESSGEAVLEKLKRGSDSTRSDGNMAPNAGPAYAASAALTWTSCSTANNAACPCRAVPWRPTLSKGAAAARGGPTSIQGYSVEYPNFLGNIHLYYVLRNV